ncbi:MAG TPA: CYTH domain-containing protein, partial [Bacillales bacterium]|nr:CYTH domain-containing protein [Bacillales bacterium]
MSREIEIEFKNLLTKQEFGQLFHYFGLENKTFTLQHNHYFDTRDFMLKEQNCALRIREKNGHYTLTMKQPQPVGLLEIHQKLTKQEYERIKTQCLFPDGEVTKELLEMNVPPATLVHFGTLSTKRVETGYQEGLLVLDHSFYLGTED